MSEHGQEITKEKEEKKERGQVSMQATLKTNTHLEEQIIKL